jgi:hypothetical protein
MEPTHGDYNITEVESFDALSAWLTEFKDAPSIEDKAGILAELLMNGHKGVSGYLTFGNNKVSKNTGIFNMNSATDCPNAASDKDNPTETGVCQVPFAACYAHKSENVYPDALKKRRLQEYLWDNVSAEVFAKAFRRVKERKRSSFEHLRVSESGDFRNDNDIKKWDKIARRLDSEINVYTYSASHKLDWSEAEHFNVMQSNNHANYGNNLYTAVPSEDDIPENAVQCAYEGAEIKCGDCRMCIDQDFDKDVYITLH